MYIYVNVQITAILSMWQQVELLQKCLTVDHSETAFTGITLKIEHTAPLGIIIHALGFVLFCFYSQYVV